jgi:streptogramin lyase
MAEATASLEYRPSHRIGGKGSADHQFRKSLHGIALDDDDRIHAVGDSVVKVFTAQGDLIRQWPITQPAYSVAVDGDGRTWVGQWRQIEVYDPQGSLVDTWKDPERLGLISDIAVGAGGVFLADASGRCIRRFDQEGRFLNNIGDRHRKGGFDIPNGVVDFKGNCSGVSADSTGVIRRASRAAATRRTWRSIVRAG